MSSWMDVFEIIINCFNAGISFVSSFEVGGISALSLFMAGAIISIIIAHIVPSAGSGLNLQ